MTKTLIACLVFLFGCLPTAYGAEEVFIPNTAPQELCTYLVGQAQEKNALIREKSDAFLITQRRPQEEPFSALWGKNAYLRHLYRFYPQDNGTRVTYEIQAINGAQSASFALSRLGDYYGKRSFYVQLHLLLAFEHLFNIRNHFDSAYIYGIKLAPMNGRTVKIAFIQPNTPCAEAGLKAGDEVLLFAGIDVKYADTYSLLCRQLQCELDLEPLTLTILRDGKKQNLRILPRQCSPKEYADWYDIFSIGITR